MNNNENSTELISYNNLNSNPMSDNKPKDNLVAGTTTKPPVEIQTEDLDAIAAACIDRPFLIKRSLIICTSLLFTGYYWLLYNELFYHIKHVYNLKHQNNTNQELQYGSINGAFFGGALIGSIFLNMIFRYHKEISRIKLFRILDVLGIFAVLITIQPDIRILLFGRFFQGIVGGMNLILVNQYIKDFVPKSYLSFCTIIGPISLLTGMQLSGTQPIPFYFNAAEHFKHYWMVCTVFGIIFLMIRQVILLEKDMETPAYYISIKNDDITAEMILRKIYSKSDFCTDDQYKQAMQHIIAGEKAQVDLNNLDKEDVMNDPDRKVSWYPAFLGVYLWFVFISTGVNGAGSYSSKIYREMGSKHLSIILSSCWGLSGMLALSISLCYADKARRRFQLIWGSVFNGIVLQLLAHAISIKSVFLTALYQNLFHLIFNAMYGSVTWCYINEICHKDYLHIPYFSKWTFVLTLQQFYPIMIDRFGTINLFMGHSIICFINAIILSLVIKETIGLDKKQLLTLYK